MFMVGNKNVRVEESVATRDDLSRRRFLAAAGTASAAAGMLALGQPHGAEAAVCAESCLSVKDYGAVGNGSTDDSAAFQKTLAAAAATNGGIIIIPKGTYRIDSPLTYESSNLEISCEPGAVIDFSNAANGKTLFSVKGNLPLSGTGYGELTSDAGKGSSALACTPGKEAEFTIGDHVMVSVAKWPLAYPSTALFTPNTSADGSMDQRIGEIAVVSTTSSGSIGLRWPLIDGPYLKADSAFVSKLNLRQNIKWVGGEIIGGGAGHSHTGFFFQWCHQVQVSGVKLANCDSRSIEFSSILHGQVDGVTIFGGASTDNFYGVSLVNACQWCQVVNSSFRDCYHALNCGGSATSPGINRFITWANNHSYDAVGAAFNTHAGSEHVTISGNTAIDSAGPGVLLRNPSAVVQGNTFIRSNGGIAGRNQSNRNTSYVFADNRIIDTIGDGIAWHSPAESALDGTVAGKAIDGVTITGNEISGCSNTGIFVYSTEAWPLHSASIMSNVVRRPGYHAVRVSNGTDVMIASNSIEEVPQDRNGIRLQEALRVSASVNNLASTASGGAGVSGLKTAQCTVSGNMCNGFSMGVSLDAACADCLIEGNHFKGCESPYNLLGIGHLASRNFGGFIAVLTAAATLALKGSENDVCEVSGTTPIESIPASWRGRLLTLKFRGSTTVLDGSNLKLAGNFNATVDDTLALVCDGTNWQELSRSVN